MTKRTIDIAGIEKRCPPALLGDAYIASSLLQKSIRRSELDLAHSALVALWTHRGRNVWRRVVALAFEDVGVADIPVVVQVVSLAALHYKSSDQNSLEAAVSAATLLSDAPKDRSADHLLSAALKHPDYEWAKSSVCNISPDKRMRAAFADGLSPLERANAIWFGAGLGCGGAERLTAARADQASLVFVKCGVPEELVTAVRMAVRINQGPFVLMVPVLWWLKAQSPTQVVTISHKPPLSRFLMGVPSYTFDKHTRIGSQAIARFAARHTPIAKLLSEYVPDYRHKKAAHMAAFYTDAVPVAKQASWVLSDELERLGMEGDMYSVGVDVKDAANLISVFKDHLDVLNDYRLEKLQSFRQSTL